MPFGSAKPHDPRVRLIREKYFSVRPKPLERWLWSKNVPASAERVFWLHWQEGHQRGDWCSEIPLRRVAQECDLDVSTVTRAYQCLVRLGCIRRTDPGRDPGNPFQQATAVTEVRIPAELLQSLHRYPNRRQSTESDQATEAGRAEQKRDSAVRQGERSAGYSGAAETAVAAEAIPGLLAGTGSPAGDISVPVSNPVTPDAATQATEPFQTPMDSSVARPLDVSPPAAAPRGRERARALAEITSLLSPAERDAYHGALRLHHPTMAFDFDSKVPAEKRAFLEATLAALAADATASRSSGLPRSSTAPHGASAPHASKMPLGHSAANAPKPRLSVFHLARLKRDIQSATSCAAAPELVRQVVWSIEAGALRRFSPLHALNIALKKIREGSWTRPHRMPPNWARSLDAPSLSVGSAHGTCSAA